MKHLRKLLAGCLVMGLFSCSSDENIVDNNGGNVPGVGQDVYATLTLKLPTSTRSAASEGDEYGQDYENKVGSVLIVLAENTGTTEAPEYKYITSSLSDGQLNAGTGVAPANPKYTVVFQNEALVAKAGTDVHVFAYANPTAALKSTVEALTAGAAFTDEIATLDESIWANNSFFMTSVGTISKVTLPTAEKLASENNTPEKAFDLGTVPVVRAAARFDYKQANAENEYAIEAKEIAEDGTENTYTVGHVVLTDMSLFNLATQYYYLPRTSANGLNTSINLCPGKAGMEENWVVGPMAAAFQTYTSESLGDLENFFSNKLNNNNASRNWTAIKSLNKDDNHDTTWDEDNDEAKAGYKIWRYATENTIPQAADGGSSAQKKGITTGVVFKGKIVIKEGSRLAETVKDNENIYMFNKVMYGGKDALYKAVKNAPVSTLADAFNACFDVTEIPAEAEDGEATVTVTPKESADFAAAGFTVYTYDATVAGYPVYYYYYNRHNDNGDNNVMGAMEFGVVRNNVYKLSVTKINQFGAPTDDGEDPDDPDEESDTYFQVSVEVLPWVVRINNIEF